MAPSPPPPPPDPPAVHAFVAVSPDAIATARARSGRVCVQRGGTERCVDAPAGPPGSVHLVPWLGDRLVVVLEVATDQGWTWYFNPGVDMFDDPWGEVLESEVRLQLTGASNPDGDSLQLLLTTPARPAEGWLWIHHCPIPDIPGIATPVRHRIVDRAPWVQHRPAPAE